MSIEHGFLENKTELSRKLMDLFLEIVGRETMGANYKPLIFKN